MKLKPYIKKIYLNYFAKKYTVLFLEQLIVLLELEISLSDCFKILGERSTNLFIKTLSLDIYQDLLQGYSLEKAIHKHNYFISPWLKTIITISTQNHILKKALKQYLKHHKQIKKIKTQLLQQLIYPCLLLLAAVLLLFFYNYQILPSYQNLFKQFHGQLPQPINFEVIIHLGIFIISLLFIFFNTKIEDSIPIWGTLKQQYHWYKWFSSMQIGIQSGMRFYEVLKTIEPQIKNKSLENWHQLLLENLEFGQLRKETFKSPPNIPKLIKPYFDLFLSQSESLEFYKKITQILEQNIQNTFKKLQEFLPIFAISIMSLFSGYIIFIFYQPLLQLTELI